MNKVLIASVIGAVLVFGFGLAMFSRPGSSPSGLVTLRAVEAPVTVFKSATCGCCAGYANYLSSYAGLQVSIKEMPDLASVKEKYDIPSSLQSCHTTVIEGYVVEGHIPAEAIEKLIKEKPDIKGIAMPGMPSGSPGMPGQKTGKFVIFQIHKDGSYAEFMRI